MPLPGVAAAFGERNTAALRCVRFDKPPGAAWQNMSKFQVEQLYYFYTYVLIYCVTASCVTTQLFYPDTLLPGQGRRLRPDQGLSRLRRRVVVDETQPDRGRVPAQRLLPAPNQRWDPSTVF